LRPHLRASEPLIEEPRRIFAQHPKDRRPAPCSDEPAKQGDQQPSPDPPVLPIRGDTKGGHFAGEGGAPAGGLCTADAWTAYAYSEKSGKVCYLAGEPKKSEPAGGKRKHPLSMVTHRPGEKSP